MTCFASRKPRKITEDEFFEMFLLDNHQQASKRMSQGFKIAVGVCALTRRIACARSEQIDGQLKMGGDLNGWQVSKKFY